MVVKTQRKTISKLKIKDFLRIIMMTSLKLYVWKKQFTRHWGQELMRKNEAWSGCHKKLQEVHHSTYETKLINYVCIHLRISINLNGSEHFHIWNWSVEGQSLKTNLSIRSEQQARNEKPKKSPMDPPIEPMNAVLLIT